MHELGLEELVDESKLVRLGDIVSGRESVDVRGVEEAVGEWEVASRLDAGNGVEGLCSFGQSRLCWRLVERSSHFFFNEGSGRREREIARSWAKAGSTRSQSRGEC